MVSHKSPIQAQETPPEGGRFLYLGYFTLYWVQVRPVGLVGIVSMLARQLNVITTHLFSRKKLLEIMFYIHRELLCSYPPLVPDS